MSAKVTRHAEKRADAVSVRRPRPDDRQGILKVLRTANFHRIGSPEMPTFPLSRCFVAVAGRRVVGVGGYRILDRDRAKTTLLAVDPAWRGLGIGERLQEARLDAMRKKGVREIYTNTDDELVIEWLTRKYGFRRTGKTIEKVCSFGREDKDHWVNLLLELKPEETS